MSNFELLHNLIVHTALMEELNELIVSKNLSWKYSNQICLTSMPGYEDNWHLGSGSLFYDWDTKREIVDDFGNKSVHIDPYITPMYDRDFTALCNVFKGTMFETVYDNVTKHYNVGRIRLIKSNPKTAMSWHVDDTIRLHYPIKTQEGCLMIINDEVKYLAENLWWKTNTINPHTAVNASNSDRIHLVVNVL